MCAQSLSFALPSLQPLQPLEQHSVAAVAHFSPHGISAQYERRVQGRRPRLCKGFSTQVKAKYTMQKKALQSYDLPALAFTSLNHTPSFSLFFPSRPQELRHSWRSSSHSLRSRRLCWMPFAAANCSHFVCGLGVGSSLVRGSWVVGRGRRLSGPSVEGRVGSWRRVEMRT